MSPLTPAVAQTITGKYLSLTSYRRDATGVATPVWFVEEDGRLLVETDGESFKVRRIRANPYVTIRTCTVRGRPLSEPIAARAELLPESEVARVEPLFERKYRLDLALTKPIRWVLRKLHVGRPRGQSVIVAITPT